MQTYRRLASTASSTSRSASSSMHHPASVSSHSAHSAHNPSRLSRSSSSTSSVISPSMTPVDSGLSLANAVSSSYGRMGSLPIARDIIRNSSYASTAGTTSDYTHAELETIAESLLAHVTFGPYHLASSPVPSSHLRLAMSTKENINNSTTITDSGMSSSATPTLTTLRPSSRRHFEGKEGSERNHHPRARFTIGAGESERGRGMARKNVGLSIRDLNGGHDSFAFERGREMRGRSGSVKELQ